MQMFLANNFFWVLFFLWFSQIWNQRKILRIFDSHLPKKKKKIFGVIVYIYEFFGTSRMEIRKKLLIQLKNFFNQQNITWHLFAGEFHQVVKITVT
jgi:hypothetical protein